jgi:hypothetical protein
MVSKTPCDQEVFPPDQTGILALPVLVVSNAEGFSFFFPNSSTFISAIQIKSNQIKSNIKSNQFHFGCYWLDPADSFYFIFCTFLVLFPSCHLLDLNPTQVGIGSGTEI